MERLKDDFVSTLETVLPLGGKTVLEIGCGDGRLSVEIAKKCAQLVGIDPDRKKVEAAWNRGIPNARFLVHQAEYLPFANRQFDIVIFTLSLHHVPGHLMTMAIDEAARVTDTARPEKGGYIVFLEPGFKGSFFDAEIKFDACDGDERAVKKRALLEMTGHPGLLLIKRLADETAFRFSSIADFTATMEPKQNLDELPLFLKRHNFVLEAERVISIFRLR